MVLTSAVAASHQAHSATLARSADRAMRRRARREGGRTAASPQGRGEGVRLRHKGDDPDEIWLECGECKGAGWINIPEEENVLAGGDPWAVVVEATCPDCDGDGYYEGEPDDVDETRWTD